MKLASRSEAPPAQLANLGQTGTLPVDRDNSSCPSSELKGCYNESSGQRRNDAHPRAVVDPFTTC